MFSPDRPTAPRSGLPARRRLYVSGLLVVLLAGILGAQTPRRSSPPLTPLQAATQAFHEGRYDDVDQQTDKLDARDPAVIALKARAAIARGRYAQAEAVLTPVAQRAPASEAALELGLLERMLGRASATNTLQRLVRANGSASTPTEIAIQARALRALGRSQEANAAYRIAAEMVPDDAAVNTGWGELFLEKYNKREAVKSFQPVLQANPKYVPALLGMAEVLADENPPQAIEFARRALAINASSVDAYIFLARQAADAGHRDEARQSLAKALAVNPSNLEAHALLAGLAYVEDKQPEFEAEVAKALEIAPNYGEAYRIAAEMAAHNYRFDDAVILTRRALALAPGDSRALGDLGVHLLRTGDEPGARTSLDAAFGIDPYDVVTFNLLGLMDRLDKFTTVRDGDVVLRMDPAEAPVLQESVLALAHQALNTLAQRWEFTPRGPILIEVFPRHDDFAVRNAGLPGMIGALGACFGRVVTMDSPKAQPPGTFQWEATLWHELAHVITLQMSNQRIPRWLTEGISEFEEKRARPDWARQMDLQFAQLLETGDAIKLKDLNAAFQDPRTIGTAYYQAGQLVEHLVTAYGDEGLRKLVRSFSRGLDTEAALKSELNTDFDQLQVGFDQSLDRVFGGLRRALAGPDDDALAAMPLETLRTQANENPRSYPVQMALGRALVKAASLDEAMQAFERAAALIPTARGKNSPHAEMAAIAEQKKDRARQISELQALVAADFDNVEAARQLAALLQQANIDDPARLGLVYGRIVALDPFDADAHRGLGRIKMQRNEPEAAAREFRAVLALKPVDLAAAHTDLAESYLKSGKTADAKKQTLAALEIAPGYERAQTLLLQLAEVRQ